MGLDMYFYLRERHCEGAFEAPAVEQVLSLFPKDAGDIARKFTSYPVAISVKDYKVLYFRNVHAVHRWIVDNCAYGVDECQEIVMELSDLKELRSDAQRVLRAKKTMKTKQGFVNVASQVMPVRDDFFFKTDNYYDDYYVETLKTLVEALDSICEMMEKPEHKNDRIVYQADW